LTASYISHSQDRCARVWDEAARPAHQPGAASHYRRRLRTVPPSSRSAGSTPARWRCGRNPDSWIRPNSWIVHPSRTAGDAEDSKNYRSQRTRRNDCKLRRGIKPRGPISCAEGSSKDLTGSAGQSHKMARRPYLELPNPGIGFPKLWRARNGRAGINAGCRPGRWWLRPPAPPVARSISAPGR
jgi:hypothetical protein